MRLDHDFSEFIGCLNAREVRFLVVGGDAVAAHGHPRCTGDLDVWLFIGVENAERLLRALEDFGFGSLGLIVGDFAEPGRVVHRTTFAPSNRDARSGTLRRWNLSPSSSPPSTRTS